MRVQRLLVPWIALAAACLTAGAQLPSDSRQPLRTLTTTREVHSLPPDQAARAYPVRLRVVVTYYDPYIDSRHGALFVCDRTGCIFVAISTRPILSLQAGTLVEITGVSGPGDYASDVLGTEVRVAGQSHLPTNPSKLTLTQLLTGAFDAQWVEIEGRVRSVHLKLHNVALEIATEDGTVDAVSLRQDGVDYQSLVDSLIRLRSNAGAVTNQHQLVGVRMFFSTLRQVSVIQPASRDPFAVPAVPIAELFRYSPDPGLLRRVHVQGEVTLDWPGRMLCIQDATNGICMQTAQADDVPLGSFVDVAGFPAINLFKPSLEDAVFRAASGLAAPPPIAITPDQAVKGNLDGKLVRIDAELVGRDFAAAEPTLMLRAGGVLLPAILPKDAALGAALPWKEGSIVRITGVCNVQVDSLSTNLGEGEVRPESMHILLRSIDDVSLVQAPSWWTPRQILEVLAAAGIVVLSAFTWIVVLRHRVKLQTRALRASEERLRHLSEHDALTGLPNRILLNDRLQTALKRAERFETCLGLLLVDVDGFKEVNDAFGHQAGDTLLCELAGRLNECVRATDTVARIGGDEFVVLLPDLRIPAEAANIAAEIVAAVSTPMAIDHAQTVITASIGVVTYPEGSTSQEALMQCADEAMYAAKEKGKNGFQVYRPKPVAFGGEGGSVLGPVPHSPLPLSGV